MSSTTAVNPDRPAGDVEILPRCCPSHADWPTLAQHLVDTFPELAISDIVRELRAARDAARDTGLIGADAIAIAELIARHQLLMLAGCRSDTARLDPEEHSKRR